jgi:hypothetical protein
MDNLEKAKWLAEMYTALAEGKLLEKKCVTYGWVTATIYPDMNSNPKLWRIKPEPRVHIDYVRPRAGGGRFVYVPNSWPLDAAVRVTELTAQEIEG